MILGLFWTCINHKSNLLRELPVAPTSAGIEKDSQKYPRLLTQGVTQTILWARGEEAGGGTAAPWGGKDPRREGTDHCTSCVWAQGSIPKTDGSGRILPGY